MNFGQLAIRGTLGPLFIGHGTQKLFGWFGGHGLDGTGGFFEDQLGLRPGKRHATAAGAAEAAGGALILLGAFTPVASALVSGTMVTAIRKVHAPNGPWVTDSGYEYNALVLAAVAALTDAGPGKPSVDAARFPRMRGAALAVAALAAGVAGSYIATELASDDAPAEGDAPAPPGDPASSSNGNPQTAEATA